MFVNKGWPYLVLYPVDTRDEALALARRDLELLRERGGFLNKLHMADRYWVVSPMPELRRSPRAHLCCLWSTLHDEDPGSLSEARVSC